MNFAFYCELFLDLKKYFQCLLQNSAIMTPLFPQITAKKPAAFLVVMVVLYLFITRVRSNKYNVFDLGDLFSSAVTDCPL